VRVLLDACVLSELKRAEGSATVRQAVQAIDSENLYVSVISIGEIANGVALLDDGQRKRDLQAWLEALETRYSERILAIDLETARIWGEVTAAARKAGRRIAAADGLIASTALRHGLRVMTRNVSDFAPAGVLLVNPWGEGGA
jgi:toxin FitB